MISQLALLPRGGWGGQIRKAVLAKPPTTSHFWIWEPYRSEWVGQCWGTVCRLFIPPQQSQWYSPDAADFWDGRWVRWWEMGKSGLQNGGNLSSPVHLAVIEKPFPQEHLESFKESGIQRGFSRCWVSPTMHVNPWALGHYLLGMRTGVHLAEGQRVFHSWEYNMRYWFQLNGSVSGTEEALPPNPWPVAWFSMSSECELTVEAAGQWGCLHGIHFDRNFPFLAWDPGHSCLVRANLKLLKLISNLLFHTI